MATKKRNAPLMIYQAPSPHRLAESFISAYGNEIIELPFVVYDPAISATNRFLLHLVILSVEYQDCGKLIAFKGCDRKNVIYHGFCSSSSLIGGSLMAIK